jgi:prevent-host-death family protein
MPVGVRELKNRLSHYLRAVKGGEKLAITERGKIIAYITPASKKSSYEEILSLVREGKAVWKGEKPAGSEHPAKISGRPVSQIVIEGRR